jgi:acyl carrier protein
MWYSSLTVQQTDDAITAQVTTEPQSPWFSGHFPGDPVLPGIAQLQMVADIVARALAQDLVLVELTRIKFKKLIRPGEILDICARAGNKENTYTFRISSKQEDVCSGTLTLAPTQENEPFMSTDIAPTILRIAEIIINELKLEDVTPETFDPDLDLVDEVGVDSMDLATIALILRDEYGIRIDEDDYPKLTTVRIIADYIPRKQTEDE